MCGTPNYIAPEIVESTVAHSYEVDIWSAGIICFACLYDRPPFETNEVKMTYKKQKFAGTLFHSSLSQQKNTTVPQEAKDFIRKILVLEPKSRLTTKQMLSNPFMTNQDILKSLSPQANIFVIKASFKSNEEIEPVNGVLTKVNSSDRLRPQDLGKKQFERNESIFFGTKAELVNQLIILAWTVCEELKVESQNIQPTGLMNLQRSKRFIFMNKKEEKKTSIINF